MPLNLYENKLVFGKSEKKYTCIREQAEAKIRVYCTLNTHTAKINILTSVEPPNYRSFFHYIHIPAFRLSAMPLHGIYRAIRGILEEFFSYFSKYPSLHDKSFIASALFVFFILPKIALKLLKIVAT